MQESLSSPLRDRDSVIVTARLAGLTIPEIAVQTGYSTDTIYRRLRDPHVKAALTEGRAAAVAPMVRQALTEVERSVKVLAEVRDNAARDSDKTRAAVELLNWFRNVWELAELAPRLAALEAQLAARATDGRDADTTRNENHNPHSGAVPPGLVEDDTELA